MTRCAPRSARRCRSGACDVTAVRYLLTEAGLRKDAPPTIDVGMLARYDRPMPTMAEYDVLLAGPCAGTA